MKTELVVLGGGPGGYAAAFLAADLGMQVTLIDLESRLGGVCLLRGCIPSKALLHVAKSINEANHLKEWGVEYAPPQIDINRVRERKEKVITTLTSGLKQIASKRKIQVLQARAVFENASTLKLEYIGESQEKDAKVEFKHCILATGSSPTRIPAFDIGSSRVMDSTGALALEDIPETFLVVGGGYIGLEMGAVYAALGSQVTVVEMTDGLLPGADRDLVRPLQKKLESQFKAIYLNTKVSSLKEQKKGIEVTFEGELAEKVQTFSRVLVSVGRRPNSQGLGLEKTKVKINSRGFVEVNPQRQTAEPSIYAIGDVAGDPMLAHKAAHEGKLAVEAIAGHNVVFSPRAIPAVVFTDPEIAWAGLTEAQAKAENRPIEVAQFPWAALGRAQAVGRTEGMTKWIIDPKTDRLLGCGIVGYNAGDLISEAVLAIEMGAVARDLTETIHPHPTFSETLGSASEVFFGTATDLYRPKRNKKE